MKKKNLEKCWLKRGLMQCIWSNLNVPGNGSPCLIQFISWKISFSGYWTTGVIRMGSQYEGEEFKKFWLKRGLMQCIWSSLNVQGNGSPLSHPSLKLEDFPFLIIGPLW